MDVDQAVKDDGMELIVESKYTLKNLLDYLKTTVYADKCEFLEAAETPTIPGICWKLAQFLTDKMTLQNMFPVLVASSMTYFLEGANSDNMSDRLSLLYQAFSHIDTLSPMHIHMIAKGIWETFKKDDDISYVFCILSLCNQISFPSETGRAVAIVLAWTILARITETDTEMYCFHEFSEINVMLKEIDEDEIKIENKTQIIYILIQTIDFLINTIIYSNNELFVKAGYRNYFKYKQRDLEDLKIWAENLSTMFRVRAIKPGNFWELRMLITESVMELISLLHDKIVEMSAANPEV